MKHEQISARTLNFSYLTGKKSSLSFKDTKTVLKPLIFYIDHKTMGLSVANNSIFKRGSSCYVEVLYQEHILKIDGTIKAYEDGILYLSMPRKVEKIQQRGYLRVGCEIKCSIEYLATGKIRNLSAGGAFVILDSQKDDIVFDENKFKLCFSINNRDLRLTCRVVEYAFSFVRAEFLDVDEDTLEFLTQYCCNLDEVGFRGEKNDR